MRYPNIQRGIFVARPNRFVAHVEWDGQIEVCHVKNTGRCKELLLPGVGVYLVRSEKPNRKTNYDLVAVEKECSGTCIYINMDSQAPNLLFREWVKAGNFRPDITLLKAEKTHGNSRFDYYWESSEKRGFVEVKGVTLEQDRIARFPDAPTLRGVKHLEELMRAKREGYGASICFMVQMGEMRWLEPNDITHPEFGAVLRRCAEAGVEILAVECDVEPGQITPVRRIPVKL